MTLICTYAHAQYISNTIPDTLVTLFYALVAHIRSDLESGEYDAGEPQRQNHSPVENWRVLIKLHIEAQFQENGQLKVGRSQPGWSQQINRGNGGYQFANICFYVDPNGDAAGKRKPFKYNVTHFPTPNQSSAGGSFYT